MAQIIRLTGIRAEGRHGAREGERDRPQPFVVDLEVEVAPADDDLDATADYRAIVELVRDVVGRESFAIIERLAGRVAEAVASLPHVDRCRAVVHKPLAAERLDVTDVSAEADASAPGDGPT